MKKVSLLLVSLCLVFPSLAVAQLCGDPWRAGNVPDISEIETCFGIDECVTIPNKDYDPSVFLIEDRNEGSEGRLPSKVDVNNVFSM